MSSEPPVLPLRKPSARWRRWGCGCLVACIVIGSTLAASVAFVARQRYKDNKQAFVDAIDRIKRSGAPVSAEDLQAYNAVRPGELDLTEQYLAAFSLHEPTERVPDEFQSVPLVNSVYDKIPPLGEPWPALELTERYLAGRKWLVALEELGRQDGKVATGTDYSQDFWTDVRYARQVTSACCDLELAAATRLHRGDRAGALAALEGLAGCARVVERDPIISFGVVRDLAIVRTIMLTQDFLAGGQASPNEIARARRLLPGDLWRRLPKEFRGERALAIQFLKHRSFADFEKKHYGKASRFNWSSGSGLLAESRPVEALSMIVYYNDSIAAIEGTTDLNAPSMVDAVKKLLAAKERKKERERLADRGRIWDTDGISAIVPDLVSRAINTAQVEARRRSLGVALDVEERLMALPSEQRTVGWVLDYLRKRLREISANDPMVTYEDLNARVGPWGYDVFSPSLKAREDYSSFASLPGMSPFDVGIRVKRPLIDDAPSATEP